MADDLYDAFDIFHDTHTWLQYKPLVLCTKGCVLRSHNRSCIGLQPAPWPMSTIRCTFESLKILRLGDTDEQDEGIQNIIVPKISHDIASQLIFDLVSSLSPLV